MSKAIKPVHPALPSTDHKGFWLAVYLQDEARLEVLRSEADKYRAKRSATETGNLAFISAIGYMQADAKTHARHTLEDGLLLCAHAHTTYFNQQVAA